MDAIANTAEVVGGSGSATRFTREFLDIRCCDCMELLEEYPDKHFDLAIVDPPYGIGAERGKNETDKAKFRDKPKGWDAKPPTAEYFIQLFRVSKNQIIWGANHFIENIPQPNSKHWIIWDKKNPGRDCSEGEMAWGSQMDSVRIYNQTRVMELNRADGGKIHPTQKPVGLYRWLLEKYASPGDSILDTHLGSGSIAIACHYAQLHLTSCELDPDYFAAACSRIKSATAQETFGFYARDRTANDNSNPIQTNDLWTSIPA